MSKRYLVVGDVHTVVTELEDCQKLLNLVHSKCKEYDVNTLIFLGDQFHHHNVVDVRVTSFWLDFLNIKEEYRIILLTGNHDQSDSRNESSRHALEPFKNIDWVTVVDRPYVQDNILFLPYYYDSKRFTQLCKDNPTIGLVCHQEFNGMRYENGFLIDTGANVEELPQKWIRSGHVHLKSAAGKIKYVGSPRWRIASDANQEKSITLLDIDDYGNIINEQDIDVSEVMTPLYMIKDTVDSPASDLKENAKYVIDIHGSKQYVNQRKIELNKPNIRIRTFIEDAKIDSIKESDGISVAFQKFFDNYQSSLHSTKEEVFALIKERIKF